MKDARVRWKGKAHSRSGRCRNRAKTQELGKSNRANQAGSANISSFPTCKSGPTRGSVTSQGGLPRRETRLAGCPLLSGKLHRNVGTRQLEKKDAASGQHQRRIKGLTGEPLYFMHHHSTIASGQPVRCTLTRPTPLPARPASDKTHDGGFEVGFTPVKHVQVVAQGPNLREHQLQSPDRRI